MTSAREQAREAASNLVTAIDLFPVLEVADAASDVWEPLLREAVAHLEAHLPGTAMVKRMKEALDG